MSSIYDSAWYTVTDELVRRAFNKVSECDNVKIMIWDHINRKRRMEL